MILFFDRALRAIAKIATAVTRFRQRRSKLFEGRQREELEAERIDRLRNPSNYQGR